MEQDFAQLHVAITPAILEVHDLYKFYHANEEETLALRGITLSVAIGETVAVMGPSGSGKSTLLACMAGLDEPDGGFVAVDGVRLTRRPEAQRASIRAHKIGILLQSGNLIGHLSVAGNVALQLELAHRGSRARVTELLTAVGLDQRAGSRADHLSGGETARAGLAIALAVNPPLILADEPTGEVDAETESQVLRILDQRKAAGGATVIATHSERLAEWADRIIRLQDGRIAGE